MATYLEFIGNHVLLVTGLFASFFLLVFTELQSKARAVTNVGPQEAVGLINADATVVDFRNAEAFSRGHIVNAKNVPHDELDDELEKVTRYKNKDKPIVVVCDAGVTSAKIVGRLRKAGVDHVYGLKGGMNAWAEASLPVVQARKTQKKSKSRK